MREKLIELIKDSNVLSTCGCHYNDIGYCSKQLSDYLLQNGVVVLPCKVGDTVWQIINNKCKDVKVENIHQWVSGHWKFDGWHGKGQYREGYEFDFNDFGKTVFLTREEAEKALEEAKLRGRGRGE